MSGWLYLIRNRDLYKIGVTRNFKNRMQQLKPDNIILKLYTSDFLKLEKELHNRYKKFRIPQTEYFRLQNYHLREIKQRLFKLDYIRSIILDVFIKSFLFIILTFCLLFLILFLNFNDINIIIIKTLIWMERLTFGYSFLSLLIYSGKSYNVLTEIIYRILNFSIISIFSFSFWLASLFLQ